MKREAATVFALASAIPPSESDLATMEPEVLKDRLAGGRQVAFQQAGSGQAEPKDTTWAWVLAGCCACLMLELVALLGFRA